VAVITPELITSVDTVHQLTADESSATSSSLKCGLSLTSRLRNKDKQPVNESESSRVFPPCTGAVSQHKGKEAVTESESSRVLPRHSAVHSNITKQPGISYPAAIGDKDMEIISWHSSVGKDTEHDSLNSPIRLRRRLGMTHRISRPSTVSKHHYQTPVLPCHVEHGDACTQPNTEDEVCDFSTVSRSSSQLDMDKSFTKLVTGLSQISHRRQVDSKPSPQTETGHSRHYQRQNSLELKCTHGRSRRIDRDHGKPDNWSDGELMDVEGGDDHGRLKDCVVMLERSQDIEIDVEHHHRGTADRGKLKDCVVMLERSQSVEKMLEDTQSRHVSETMISSHRDLSSQSHHIPPPASSSSSSSSTVARSDELRRKLSLRKFPRTDVSCCGEQINMYSHTHDSDLYVNSVAARNLNSEHHENSHLSDVAACDNVRSREDSGHVTSERAAGARCRLKRRKVCLQLTGSRDIGVEEDCCIVGQGTTDVDGRTSDRGVVGKMEVTLVQPDPDFSPPSTTVKRARTTIITSCEADIGQLEVIPQPDPDSSQPVKTTDGIDKENKAFIGQASSPQPDPDYRQPIDTTDFSRDRCTDAMYTMALFSEPETSDLDSSPPVPLSPTESCSSDNQTTVRQQTAFYRRVDDDDDDDDEEAGGYLSDTPATAEPEMKSPGHTKLDVVRRHSNCSSDLISSTSASDSLRDHDDVQQMDLDADESTMMIGVEESLNRSENISLDFVGQKDIDPTPSRGKSVMMVSSPRHSKNTEFNAVSRDTVRKNGNDFTSSDRLSLKELLKLIDSSAETSNFSKNVDCNLNEQVKSVGIGKNGVGSTPSDKSSPDDTAGGTVDGSSEHVFLSSTSLPPSQHQVVSDLASSRGESAGVTVDISSEHVVLSSTSLPPSQHQVISDLASSRGESAGVTVDGLSERVVLSSTRLPPSRRQVISDLASSSRNTLLQSTHDAFCTDAEDLPPRPRYMTMLGIYCLVYCETFLRASAMLKHVIDIGWTSVRPSLCPSVCHTLALYQNG